MKVLILYYPTIKEQLNFQITGTFVESKNIDVSFFYNKSFFHASALQR